MVARPSRYAQHHSTRTPQTFPEPRLEKNERTELREIIEEEQQAEPTIG